MALNLYALDQEAHDLVIKYRDQKDAITQAYKMRMTVAYGLERFWGEHLRLQGAKANYWKDTWDKLADIMSVTGFELPKDNINSDKDTTAIKKVADELWSLPIEQRKVALAVLTQLCDCMVWWTQRYKPARSENNCGEVEDER